MNFEEFNEKMGRRPARCCGNCHFVINQENYAPFCLVNGYPINEFFTCKFFAFDDSGLSERQYMELNKLAFEAIKEKEKRIREIKALNKKSEEIRDILERDKQTAIKQFADFLRGILDDYINNGVELDETEKKRIIEKIDQYFNE